MFGQSPDQISQMRYWLSTQLRYLFTGYALFAESGLAAWDTPDFLESSFWVSPRAFLASRSRLPRSFISQLSYI